VKHNCGLVAGHVRGDRLAPGDAADKGLLKLLDDTGAVLVTSWMKVSARTLARTRCGTRSSTTALDAGVPLRDVQEAAPTLTRGPR